MLSISIELMLVVRQDIINPQLVNLEKQQEYFVKHEIRGLFALGVVMNKEPTATSSLVEWTSQSGVCDTLV